MSCTVLFVTLGEVLYGLYCLSPCERPAMGCTVCHHVRGSYGLYYLSLCKRPSMGCTVCHLVRGPLWIVIAYNNNDKAQICPVWP